MWISGAVAVVLIAAGPLADVVLVTLEKGRAVRY
jgi:hypothetical protein